MQAVNSVQFNRIVRNKIQFHVFLLLIQQLHTIRVYVLTTKSLCLSLFACNSNLRIASLFLNSNSVLPLNIFFV